MGVSTAHKHVHNQTVPAKQWTVTHQLKTLAPIVDVMIDTEAGLVKVLPFDIVIIDASTVRVDFQSDWTGKVSVI